MKILEYALPFPKYLRVYLFTSPSGLTALNRVQYFKYYFPSCVPSISWQYLKLKCISRDVRENNPDILNI